MRTPLQALALTLLVSLLSPPAAATAEPEFFETQVGILVEYFEVDHASLTPMLREYQQEQDASELLREVQSMQPTGKARLAESSYALTTIGQTVRLRSVQELIYPSSYAPAKLPDTLAGPIDPDTKIIAPARPAGFETRWIGNLLEVGADRAGQGDAFKLKLSSDLVEFCGFKDWGEGVSKTQQPILHTLRCEKTIWIEDGHSELIGTFTPSSVESDKRLLGFVTIMKMTAASQSQFADHLINPPTPEEIKARHARPTSDPFAVDPNEPPSPPKQISVITEYIEVDAALASNFARELNTISDATAIRLRLDGIIAEGEAELLASLISISPPGQRAVSQSIREFIHPVEYDPPGQLGGPLVGKPIPRLPHTLRGPITGNVNLSAPNQATAFDTHDTGIRVELEPNLSSHGLIHLNLALGNDRLAGELNYGTGTNTTQRPVFESMRLWTNAVIPDGTSLFLAMHSLETARAGRMASKEQQDASRNRRVLVFLTAKVKTLK
jgi:hypothetical protein